MRKKRIQESDEHRQARTQWEARLRVERSSAEERELDAAVKRSIEQHGA
jgi:hypothetical protein